MRNTEDSLETRVQAPFSMVNDEDDDNYVGSTKRDVLWYPIQH